MQIRFRTLSCSPHGVFQPGQTANLPAEVAERWVSDGVAEVVQPGRVELPPGSKTAVKPQAEPASEPEKNPESADNAKPDDNAKPAADAAASDTKKRRRRS